MRIREAPLPEQSQWQLPQVSHRSRNIAVLLVIIVATAAVSGAYFFGLFGSHGPVWLFKNAYATYSGETTLLTVKINFTIRLQVLDFNSTHIKTYTYSSIQSSLGNRALNQTTTWSKRATTFNFTSVTGPTLVRTYDTTRLIGGNTVDCTAYAYSLGSSSITVYVNKAVEFPAEFNYSQMSSGTNVTLDLVLNHTNIPGL